MQVHLEYIQVRFVYQGYWVKAKVIRATREIFFCLSFLWQTDTVQSRCSCSNCKSILSHSGYHASWMQPWCHWSSTIRLGGGACRLQISDPHTVCLCLQVVWHRLRGSFVVFVVIFINLIIVIITTAITAIFHYCYVGCIASALVLINEST